MGVGGLRVKPSTDEILWADTQDFVTYCISAQDFFKPSCLTYSEGFSTRFWPVFVYIQTLCIQAVKILGSLLSLHCLTIQQVQKSLILAYQIYEK